MIKESKVLKVISYLLIPILILIIGLTFIYEIKKENIEYINNYFNSDEFVKYYINQLRNNMSYNASDNEVKDNKGYYIQYKKYKDAKIKEYYYIILINKLAFTNVELTEDTNSVEEIINYIKNKENSKYVNIEKGKIKSNSEIINKNAIKYLKNEVELYSYSDSKDMYKIEGKNYVETPSMVIDVNNNLSVYSSYKEERILNNTQKLIMDSFNKLKFLDDYSYIIIPISSIVLIGIIIYLIISVGYTKGEKQTILNDFDKLPIEILATIIVFIVSKVPNIIINNLYIFNIKFLVTILITTFIIVYIIIALFINTFIKRIKSNTLKNTSILFVLGKYLKNKLIEIINIINKSVNEIIKIIVLAIIYLFTILQLYLSFDFLGVIIDIIITLFICIILINRNIALKKIEKHLKGVCKGNLSDKLEIKDFKLNLENIALYINNISSSFENALGREMKSERFKTELITNVSHDIKTPLTSIINYIDLLKNENINDEKIKKYINILDNKSQRLKKLIEDLIEASRASSGNIKLNLERINLEELVNQSVGEFKDRFNESKLTIIKSISSENTNILADSRYMYRIIENLFMNITKYATQCSRVYIDMFNIENNKIKIELKNISKEKLNISSDELMQRFVRGDKSRTTEGSGLRIIYI